MFSKTAILSFGVALAMAISPLAVRAQGAPAPATGQTTSGPAPTAPAAPAPEQPGDQTQDTQTVTPIAIPERSVIMYRGKSKWDDGYKSLTEAFKTLRAEVDKAKLKVNGRPLAVFVQSDDDGFTFEAMMPVEMPVAAPALSAGFAAGKSPGGQALKFEHRGAYEDIESTYEAIAAYLDEKGLAARDELIEEFVNEGSGADDNDVSVDIYVLLKQ